MTKFVYFSDSDPVEVGDSLELVALWIHDPDDPKNTVKQFLYGRDLRGISYDVGGNEQVFAGRKFPVVDWGEHQNDKYTVGLEVPHGPNYNSDRKVLKDFIESKKTLCFRDNRGRVVFGAVTSLDESDENYGTSFSFEVIRVHREERRVA